MHQRGASNQQKKQKSPSHALTGLIYVSNMFFEAILLSIKLIGAAKGICFTLSETVVAKKMLFFS